jgi:hypothetical protein
MRGGDWRLVRVPNWPSVPDFLSLRVSTLRNAPEFRGLSPEDRRSPEPPDCVAGVRGFELADDEITPPATASMLLLITGSSVHIETSALT